MRRLLALLLVLSACTPEPGTRANGSFRFLNPKDMALDGLAIDSRGGLIAVGTQRDLRFLRGSKAAGYSEPVTVDLTPFETAEVNGVSVSDDGTVIWAGFRSGIAVVEPGRRADERVVTVLELPSPVARLWRQGTTLYAVSFENELTVVSVASGLAPQKLGQLTLPGAADTVRSFSLVNQVGTFSAEGMVWLVALSDPSAPRLLRQHALEGFVGWSARSATHLFTGNTGPRAVYAMSDESTPQAVGPAQPLWGLPSHAPLLQGDRLYLVDGRTGTLYVADVKSPAAPASLTRLEPNRTRVECGAARQTQLDADGVLWVACKGGAVNYVIDF